MNEEGFTCFQCSTCHTEIEASPDMIGQETECPACGAKLIVPEDHDADIARHGPGDSAHHSPAMMKSRTIRIELSDL